MNRTERAFIRKTPDGEYELVSNGSPTIHSLMTQKQFEALIRELERLRDYKGSYDPITSTVRFPDFTHPIIG